MNQNLPPESNPIAVLNRWEAKSKSLARRGLQMSLNDCLSSLRHYRKERVAAINSELERNRLPNIDSLSGTIQTTVTQVLKTGKIKNIGQYYIVREFLDDTASEILTDERSRLSDCLRNFEFAARR